MNGQYYYGSGGQGGGGDAGSDGLANTGGGGGAERGDTYAIGDGGSGVVLIRYTTDTPVDYYEGRIGSARVYDRELSDSEIKDLSQEKLVYDGLVTEWSIEEGSGDTVYDGSENKNDGKIVGASWHSTPISLDFDGTDDYGEIDGFPSIESSISVSAWIKSTAGNTYTANWSAVSRYSQFILGPNGSGDMSFIVNTPSDGWTYLSPPPPLLRRIRMNGIISWEHGMLIQEHFNYGWTVNSMPKPATHPTILQATPDLSI